MHLAQNGDSTLQNIEMEIFGLHASKLSLPKFLDIVQGFGCRRIELILYSAPPEIEKFICPLLRCNGPVRRLL